MVQSIRWGHVKHGKFLGRLSPLCDYQYCAHSFTRNWQLLFLNNRKRENYHRKYFKINLHERMLLTQLRLNPQTPDHQSDAQPTEPLKLAYCRWNSYSEMDLKARAATGVTKIWNLPSDLISVAPKRQLIIISNSCQKLSKLHSQDTDLTLNKLNLNISQWIVNH